MVIALTAAAVVGGAAPAPAAPRDPEATGSAAAVVDPPGVLMARYAFNGRSSSIVDQSGRGHTLSVVSGHGGAVRPIVHGAGHALLFPSRCVLKVCPHVALQTPSTADLNPGILDIDFGADVFLPPGQTSKGQNVVQKGYSKTSSQWKLQIDGAAGRPSCVLVGDQRPRIRVATSAVSVADGRWHRLHCSRAGATLSIYVDDVLRGRIAVPETLSVTNNRPMSIGGKGAYADNDQFNGVLDNVWVQVG